MFTTLLSGFAASLLRAPSSRLPLALRALLLLALAGGPGAQRCMAVAPVIAPALPSVHANGTQKFAVTWNGKPVANGLWYVIGGLQNGAIDQDGIYHGPRSVPSPARVTIEYIFDGGTAGTQTGITQLTVTNPVAIIGSIAPSSLTQLSTVLNISGDLFLPTSQVLVQGQPVPTTYVNQSRLIVTAVLAQPVSGAVSIGVSNPAPGPSVASVDIPAVFPTMHATSPGSLNSGWVTVSTFGTNFTPSSVVTLDGRPMVTTMKSTTQLVGYGYLPGWRTGSTVVGVSAQVGSQASAQRTLPILPTAIPYDTAARFTTQAALGPRPGLVEHIQKIGLQAFLAEQFRQPGVGYSDPTVLPRLAFLRAGESGNSLLRLRLAAAFNAFIPNQAIFLEYASIVPWQRKLETDVTGNFRTLMTDIASDSRMGNFLNLAGNNAPTDPSLHPNQNFARELLQLFTLGTTLLNEDGTPQLDSSGQPVPTYDQSTVLDLSRALTGWELPPPVNPTFTAFSIDASQPLAAHDEFHDHGAKVLFGTVHLPAGQSIVQDRTMALDAIFDHPNLPPNIARLLIQHLVTSNPSPAYVGRIADVFKDNGSGVRGDLKAVATAILLDTEARAGDTRPSPTDGFLQDPLLSQMFLANVLQNLPGDAQVLNIPGDLGQDFWYPNSIFDFYPHTYAIPGSTVNSPEFSVFNDLTALHRSQFAYGFISLQQPGTSYYITNSWLFHAFTNLPDLVEGLNHLAYHGRMSAAEQSAILAYSTPLMSTNAQQAYMGAIFLALNADSYNVSH